MVLRDMRPIAKTRMIDAGITELPVNRILGHKNGVAARYYKMSDPKMREAPEPLTLESRTPARTSEAAETVAR